MYNDDFHRSLSGRIVSSVWWLFALFLFASYTANMAAYFTVERISSSVNSVEDLVAQTEVEYGTIKDGSTWNFFKVKDTTHSVLNVINYYS